MNSKNLRLGVCGGLAGGLAFGIMMGMMGMLPMIGTMVGYPSATVGFIAHMGISAIIGASFSVIIGWMVSGVGGGLFHGLLYGGIWWLLGPLTLMPLFMGMGLGVNWNANAAAMMLPSLWGHLLFGLILGATYGWLKHRAVARASSAKSSAGAVHATRSH